MDTLDFRHVAQCCRGPGLKAIFKHWPHQGSVSSLKHCRGLVIEHPSDRGFLSVPITSEPLPMGSSEAHALGHPTASFVVTDPSHCRRHRTLLAHWINLYSWDLQTVQQPNVVPYPRPDSQCNELYFNDGVLLFIAYYGKMRRMWPEHSKVIISTKLNGLF